MDNRPSFSPGPWRLCAHLETHDEVCDCGYRGSIWSADGKHTVCELGSSPDADGNGVIQGHTVPQAERATQFADAHLIAAAPELYAQAEAAVRELELAADRLGELGDLDHADDCRLRARAIKQVMAKAEGW